MRPVNLRPVYTAIFAPPGLGDKPQERDGNGAANVVVFEPPDVQIQGARYESSACSVVPSAGTNNKTLEVAGVDSQADQGRPPQQWICLLDKTVEDYTIKVGVHLLRRVQRDAGTTV